HRHVFEHSPTTRGKLAAAGLREKRSKRSAQNALSTSQGTRPCSPGFPCSTSGNFEGSVEAAFAENTISLPSGDQEGREATSELPVSRLAFPLWTDTTER